MVSRFVNDLGLILNNMQRFYSKYEMCALDTKELALITAPGKKDLLKPEVIVFCKFDRVRNKINVKFYDKPMIVDLVDDPSRKLVKILSNNQQIESIKDRLLERSLINNCVNSIAEISDKAPLFT